MSDHVIPLFKILQSFPISLRVKHKPYKVLQSPTLSRPRYYLTVSLIALLFAHFFPITSTSFLFIKYTFASRPSHLLFSLPRTSSPDVCMALSLAVFRSPLCSDVIRKVFPDCPPNTAYCSGHLNFPYSTYCRLTYSFVCLLLFSFIKIKTLQEQEYLSVFFFTAVS